MENTTLLDDNSRTDITIRRKINWYSYALSDVGKLREVNEDALLDKPEANLWIVADGMGGYEAGEIASNMIISALDNLDYLHSLDDNIQQIEMCLQQSNKDIIEYQSKTLDKSMMGSTVLCLVIRERIAACLWAGDSRLYRLRHATLTQLSRDHSYVEELIQQGLITEQEAITHHDSNVITRAIGATDNVSIESKIFDVEAGDCYLLCSDGLYNAVNFKDLENCLNITDIEASARQLLECALENNASDNISLVLIRGEIDKTASDSSEDVE